MKHSLILFIFCFTLSPLFAMEPPLKANETSINVRLWATLPEHIQQKIIHLACNINVSPNCYKWLVDRNANKNLIIQYNTTSLYKFANNNPTCRITNYEPENKEPSFETLKNISPHKIEASCSHSFITCRPDNNHTLKQTDENHVTLSLKKHTYSLLMPKRIKIANIVDSAMSKDKKNFVIASQEGFVIFKLSDGTWIQTSCSPKYCYNAIIAVHPFLVIRDNKNRFFVYNWQQLNSKHLLFDGNLYNNVNCSIDNKKYSMTAQKQIKTRPAVWQITEYIIEDIYPLWSKLQPYQLQVINLIYKAYTMKAAHKKNKSFNKVDLSGNSQGIINARDAFFSLPVGIKQLVEDYVNMPLIDRIKRTLRQKLCI